MNFIRQLLILARIKLYTYWVTSILPYQKIPEWLKKYKSNLVLRYCMGGIAKNAWLIDKIHKNKFY
jgi:hypothetical protein